MRKTIPSLFIFLCLFSAQIYAETSSYLYYKNKASGTIDLIDFDSLYTGCDFDEEIGLTYHWKV